MWKSIKQEIRVQRSLFLGGILTAVIAWVLGMIINVIAMHFLVDETEYFCLGTVMALLFGMIIMTVMGAMVIVQGFDDAVHMGKTRKKFIPAIFLVNVAAILLPLLMTRIFLLLESALYGHLYADLTKETLPEQFLTLPWLFCYAVAAAGLAGIAGGAIKANRKVGGAVSMIIWLSICWGIPGTSEENGGRGWITTIFIRRVTDWFLSLSNPGRMGCLLAVGIVGYGIMYLILRKRATD